MDQEITPRSPLEALSYQRFGGKTYLQEKVFSLTTNLDVLLPNNPNRVFWAMINEGSFDVRLSTDPTITNTSGWLLAASGGAITMDWSIDGESVGYAIYGRSASAPEFVRIREVIRS